MDTEVRFRVLGALEVIRDGAVVPVQAGKHRVLLASLALRAGRPVSVDELIAHLWDEAASAQPNAPLPTNPLPPRPRNPLPLRPRNTVQTYVLRLRHLLGDDLISTTPWGYQLETEPKSVDLHRFRALVDRAGAAADPRMQSPLLHAALALWRGPALVDVPSAWLRSRAGGLDQERLRVLEHRLEVDLALGRHGQLIGELRALVAENPLREGFWRQLMLALYRSHRQAEALETYQHARTVLRAELGSHPGADLRALHRSILCGPTPHAGISRIPPSR